jgi:hypothetical protein
MSNTPPRYLMTLPDISGGTLAGTIETRQTAPLPVHSIGTSKAYVDLIVGPGPKRKGSSSGTVSISYPYVSLM